MKQYKLSTATIEIITQFLKNEFGFDWDGSKTPQMLNETDCFVFIGEIETGAGLHFDLLTGKDLIIPEGISQHNPTNPKHTFA